MNGRRWILVAIAAIALSVTNFLLIRENRGLKQRLSQGLPAWEPPSAATLPALEGVGLDGLRKKVQWDEPRDTFFFFFATNCKACRLSWPVWRDFASTSDPRRSRLVFVNTAHTDISAAFNLWNDLGDAVRIAEIDPKSVIAYNLRFTPEVLQASPEGRVKHVWMGFSDGEERIALKIAIGSREGTLASEH